MSYINIPIKHDEHHRQNLHPWPQKDKNEPKVKCKTDEKVHQQQQDHPPPQLTKTASP